MSAVAELRADHERIWLQNAADAREQDTGRMWCQDKVWPDDAEDGEPTEYVRADLYETALTERDEWRASATEFKGLCEELQARAEGLEKALAPLIAAYVALSGKQNDGFWNADAEPIVVTARRALSHTLTEEGRQ